VDDLDNEPRSGMDRLIASLGRASTMSGAIGGSTEQLDDQEHRIRAQVEEFLAQSSVTGGVTIGRGGMVVLGSVPWALHVLLRGRPEARLEQRMALESIDRKTAERRQRANDQARTGYVQRAYGVDGDDPSFYHMVLDSTELSLDVCVELIVAASRDRTRQQTPTGSAGEST
jgi:cytidylate kinase